MKAFKLLRVRNDGSLGPLFINRRQRIPLGEWLTSEDHPTKGYARRPGWHTVGRPHAPHLSPKGRAWFVVQIKDYEQIKRPASQGARWYLAKQMMVLEAL